jgi:hypothetical protein
MSYNRNFPTGRKAKASASSGLLQVFRVVTTDVTQMTTLPSACKGLSSYTIAPRTIGLRTTGSAAICCSNQALVQPYQLEASALVSDSEERYGEARFSRLWQTCIQKRAKLKATRGHPDL